MTDSAPVTESKMQWQGSPIRILGINEPVNLTDSASQALLDADLVIGAKRHFECLADRHLKALCLPYSSPIQDLQQILENHQHQRIVILASGDPLFYGIGSYLVRLLGNEHLQFTPALSSIQLAFNKLGLAWQQARVVSLHGRPLKRIRAVLGNRCLLVFLTDQQSTPQQIAAELTRARLQDSILWVCEALGSEQERIQRFSVNDLTHPEIVNKVFNPLHVTVVRTQGTGGVLPEFPGIDDRHFITGETPGQGMISKREVRLTALSLLQPTAEDIAWDVGAGCGGLSVEWARWNSTGQLYAIECHPQRVEHLKSNRDKFGVDANLSIIEGRAPEVLQSLPTPDAVFVGGSGGELCRILDVCWRQLTPGGRLVASAVTEQSRSALLAFSDSLGPMEIQWHQVQVSRGHPLGSQLLLRPKAPVLLMLCRKPYDDEYAESAPTTMIDDRRQP